MTMRAAIYVRVSTRHQAEEGFSLADQKATLLLMAEQRGWLPTVFEDAGVSGEKFEERPALQAMLVGIDSGKFDAVLVVDESRLARDELVSAMIRDHLRKARVTLVTETGERDLNDPSGNFMAGILGQAHVYEQALRTKKMKAGRESAVRSGYWVGGPAPYGFEVVADGAHKRLRVLEAEAVMLRAAVTAIVDDGLSTWQTAALLNGLGHKPRRAPKWNHVGLRRMLLDASLSGEWTYARAGRAVEDGVTPVVVEVPAIVTRQRHNDLLSALNRTSTGSRPRNRKEYSLSRGRLVGPCGGNFHGVYREDRDCRQYRCIRSKPEAYERCQCRRLNADDIEFVVWAAVSRLLSEPERLVNMARDYLGLRSEQMRVEQEQVNEVDHKITRLRDSIETTLIEYAREGLPASAVRAATAQLSSELETLCRHRDQMMTWVDGNVAESERMRRLWTLADVAHQRLGGLTLAEQTRVLDLLDVRVSVAGWDRCTECSSRGRVRGGNACKGCNGGRFIPSVRIEGVVYDRLFDDFEAKQAGDLDREVPRRSTCSKP